MNNENYTSKKLEDIYFETKEKAEQHINKLKNQTEKDVIESDRIFQYLQHTIDSLSVCLHYLPKHSDKRMNYARYMDELGELGEEIVKLTKPNRW